MRHGVPDGTGWLFVTGSIKLDVSGGSTEAGVMSGLTQEDGDYSQTLSWYF